MALFAIPQSFGAWIAAAITALNINLQSVLAPIEQLNYYVADPFQVVYTYPESQLDSYLDKSVIQITPGGTIIDGVTYDDIWLSHDAADIFRTNAFDFQTGNAIASESSGTFASGSGYFGGIPVFTVDGDSFNPRSQFRFFSSYGSYTWGDWAFTVTPDSSDTRFAFITITDPSGVLHEFSRRRTDLPFMAGVRTVNGFLNFGIAGNESWTNQRVVSERLTDHVWFLPSEFSFDYVSGTIPSPDSSISSDDGILIHLPSSHSGSSLSQFLEDNPEFGQPGGVVVDPSVDPDIHGKLDDIAAIIAPLINIMKSEYAPIPDVPDPPYSGPISDAPWSGLSDILKSIQQSISSIPQSISNLGDRILQDIQEGPIRLFDKFLDIFRTVFAPVFSLITSGLGIWHYVVEWLSSISSPFTFILSVLPSGVLIPVYACVAGFLVIAIFRRFGR